MKYRLNVLIRQLNRWLSILRKNTQVLFGMHFTYVFLSFLNQHNFNLSQIVIKQNVIDNNVEKICSILILIRAFISYQSRYLVNNLNQLVDKLCKLSENNNDSNVVRELLETSELQLMSENVKFSIDKIRLLISKLLFSFPS